MKTVWQLMESHGFYFVGPEFGKSHPLLQKVLSLCSTDGGFGLIQHHLLGRLGMFKAETEHCTCMLFPCPEILKFLALRLKFMGPGLSVYSLPKNTVIYQTSNRGKNLYGIWLSQMDAGGRGDIFQI